MPHRQHLERVWTVLDLIRWGTEYFTSKEVDSPRLTIELLLCDILKISRIKLYSEFDRPVLPEELATLRSYVTRRAHHEPLQYITGTAWFYSLAFNVGPDVLIPRPETEFLIEEAIRFGRGREELHCLDIGTGSGCIPIAIATHLPHSRWTATDVSGKALDVADSNIRRHGLASRIQTKRSDILSEIPEGSFDLITMNPPYIPASEVPTLDPEVRDFEPHRALTDDADGLTFYRRLAEVAPTMLQPQGLLLMELGWASAPDVQELFEAIGAIRFVDDLQGIPRIACCTLGGVTTL